LECDTGGERALAAEEVDQEEGADHGTDKLDDTEDGCSKQLLLLTAGAHHLKVLGCVAGDRVSCVREAWNVSVTYIVMELAPDHCDSNCDRTESWRR